SDVGPLRVRAGGDRAAPAVRDDHRERARAAPRVERRRRGEGTRRVSPAMRRLANTAMSALSFLAALTVICPLLLVLGFLLYRGVTAVNVDLFLHLPKPVGEPGGGLANAIVGSLIMIGLAGCLGLPIGILGGVYLAESRDRRLPWTVRFLADVF